MSKIAIQKALKAYPPRIIKNGNNYDHNSDRRYIYIQGYDQSAKDTIERIRAGVKKLCCQFGEVTKVDVFELLSELEKELKD